GRGRRRSAPGGPPSADVPDTPTMIESGYPDYVLSFWTGILAPAGTPAGIVDKLNGAVVAGLRSPEARQNLAKFSVEPHITTPQEFSAFLAAPARKWADIVKRTNIRVE